MKRIVFILLLISSQWVYSQNAPITTIGTVSTYGTTTTVALTVTNFTNIASFNLDIMYDPTIATYSSVAQGSGLNGGISGFASNGHISIGWFTYPPATLANNDVLLTITFNKVIDGTSPLTFFDPGPDSYNCIFQDANYNPLNDIPTSTYYINGAVTFATVSAPQTIAPTILACAGTEVSVPVTVNNFNNIGSVALTMQYNA